MTWPDKWANELKGDDRPTAFVNSYKSDKPMIIFNVQHWIVNF